MYESNIVAGNRSCRRMAWPVVGLKWLGSATGGVDEDCYERNCDENEDGDPVER